MRSNVLRSSWQFQFVYRNGKRYDNRYVTIFATPNDLCHHRFGLTVSRRISKKAVERNRIKRLLREAIRSFNEMQIEGEPVYYDYVINAKRALLGVKLLTFAGEFTELAASVISSMTAGAKKS